MRLSLNEVNRYGPLKTLAEIEGNEPFQGFNKLMAMNGWYWEPYGSVICVVVESRNLVRIQQGTEFMYKTLGEFKGWMSRMGYEKEDEDQSEGG